LKLILFALNQESLKLGTKLKEKTDHELEICYCGGFSGMLAQKVTEAYGRYDGLVFITAAGIAVRLVAPLITSKTRDPAVVVLDPRGRFVVSLLSGHLGGANRLAEDLAGAIGATPVITTATDALGHRPVEDWAAALNLNIINPGGLVKVNSAIVAGEPLLVYSSLKPEFFAGNPLTVRTIFRPLEEAKTGESNLENYGVERPGASVAVTAPVTNTAVRADLFLVPRCLAVGVGCRRGTPSQALEDFLTEVLQAHGLNPQAVKKIVSIEAKAEEAGIWELAGRLKAGCEFYPAAGLEKVFSEHPELEYSQFVKDQVGVGGVCEPAAIWGARGGKLLVGKTARQGVTLAVAREPLPWWAWDQAALST